MERMSKGCCFFFNLQKEGARVVAEGGCRLRLDRQRQDRDRDRDRDGRVLFFHK